VVVVLWILQIIAGFLEEVHHLVSLWTMDDMMTSPCAVICAAGASISQCLCCVGTIWIPATAHGVSGSYVDEYIHAICGCFPSKMVGQQHQMNLHPGMRAQPSHTRFILRNCRLLEPFPVGRCCGCQPIWNRSDGILRHLDEASPPPPLWIQPVIG